MGTAYALMLAGAGLFWWQGQASVNASAPPAPKMTEAEATGLPIEELPTQDGDGMEGAQLPGTSAATREEKRFNRLDRNRDNLITGSRRCSPALPHSASSI